MHDATVDLVPVPVPDVHDHDMPLAMTRTRPHVHASAYPCDPTLAHATVLRDCGSAPRCLPPRPLSVDFRLNVEPANAW